jgi:hypothetical protein
MSKKNFYRYLEEASGKDNLVVSKIKEIINFKEKIKNYKILKENFSFYHYPQGNQFNPYIYTNDESIMSGTYVSSLEELKQMIESSDLYSENNSINYNIEYLENDAVISKSFSTEENEDEDSYGYSSSEQENFYQSE